MSSTLTRLPKFLLALAAVLGALGGLAVLLTAGATQVSASNGVQTVTQLNWVEAQGAWGIIILFIFAALYYAPWRFYTRGRRGMAILFAAASVVLTILASFSIGIYYYASGMAVLLALLSMPFDPA